MPRIVPFRALRFDPTRLPDTAKVIAPPYDVISADQRAVLEAQHARNIVHLDLPRGEGDAKYEHARELLTPGWPTAACAKDHRGAFFADLHALYRDPQGVAEAALERATTGAPDVDATTPDGCRHRLWAVTDKATIAAVVQAMAPKQVMIADGHHRYETMVAIRDALRPAGAAPGTSQADFGPMFFARAEDPGLLVLPTHRMVHGAARSSLDRLAELASPGSTSRTAASATPPASANACAAKARPR
jgi:uncharacterized protein (DUF1015 family)